MHELPAVTAPRRKLPPGACDAHVHISDGTGRFPIQRITHPPVHAPLAAHEKMRDALGLDREVAIQLMAYADDNSALLEALKASGGGLKGIAEVSASIDDRQLESLRDAGICGLRFYLEPPKTIPGLKVKGAGLADLLTLAPRMEALGLIAEISAGCDLITQIAPELSRAGIPILFEHMAGCLASRGIADPSIRRVIDLMRNEPFWVKLTICAMSDQFPDYSDLRPIHDAFVSAAPDRTVWGSNWPHGLAGPKTPDSGHLLDLFDDWLDGDDRLRRAVLSENPERLFGF